MSTAYLLSNPEIEKRVIGETLGEIDNFRERMPHVARDLFTDPLCIAMVEELLAVYQMEKRENDRQLRFWEAPLAIRLRQMADGWTADNRQQNTGQFQEEIRLLRDLARRREWVSFLTDAQLQACVLNRTMDSIMEQTAARAMSLKESWFPSSPPADFEAEQNSATKRTIEPDDTPILSSEMAEDVVQLLSEILPIMEGKEATADHNVMRDPIISLLSGFEPGKLYLISGLGDEERIAFLLHLACAALRENGIRIGISVGSYERRDLLLPLLFQCANDDIQCWNARAVSDFDFHELCVIADKIQKYLDIRCSTKRTLGDMRNQIGNMIWPNLKKVLLIDDLRDFGTNEKSVCNELRRLAQSYDSTIVTFSEK